MQGRRDGPPWPPGGYGEDEKVAARRAVGAVNTRWLGTLDYAEGLALQEAAWVQAVAGGPPTLFGLEHRPVLTLGKRGGAVRSAAAAAAGYAVWSTRRGGLATCHEPGQLVGYVVVDARAFGVRALVHRLEGCLIDWLDTLGLAAARRAGLPGIWVGDQKLASVGLRIRGGFSTHGFALNLCNGLRGFDLIDPCGMPGVTPTSVRRLCRAAPTPQVAWESLGPALRLALCPPNSP